MDAPMLVAYQALEEDIRAALKEHKGNRSVHGASFAIGSPSRATSFSADQGRF
jgi:hypothetical protein